ncbi:protein of unknown function (plasmid) [Azospirillum baldaniorum]|uniref:Uncharacterized protein n=1 Tax=Azospirillum baldaniorum TaxID=1064539 RepID=A0A9P1JXC4_9PROT|nr:protein of unknown function [Azospirillum baldaniorum]
MPCRWADDKKLLALEQTMIVFTSHKKN